MSQTHHGEHKAIVKESAGGVPFITFELLRGEEIPAFRNAVVGIRLDDDTTYEEAARIAQEINSRLVGMYITQF